MPRWTSEQLKRKQQRNPHLQAVGAGEDAAPEPTVRHASSRKGKVQGGDTERFLIRVRSYRTNLADEDGLVAKYHVDCLRYISIVPDDSPAFCKIEVSQEKVPKGEERTLIEVFRLNASPSNVVSEDK